MSEKIKALTTRQWERLFTLVSALHYDEPWKPIYEWICEQRSVAYRRQHEEADQKGRQGLCADADLVYAAFSRCECGAGLAYHKGIGIHGYWDCSDILTGRAVHKDQPGSKRHSDQFPFAFYEIKSEDQPSANGATTRPKTDATPSAA